MKPHDDLKTSSSTYKLIELWQSSKDQVTNAERDLNNAKCNLQNIEIELGKWLVPDNWRDVPFNVWIGDKVLTARKSDTGDFTIEWMKLPNK